MLEFHLSDKDRADGGVGQELVDKRDAHRADLHERVLRAWPILVALDPAHLLLPGQHHHHTGILLPRRLPEILECRRQWSLSGDIALPTQGRCQKRSIDIVVVSSVDLSQLDTGVIVWPDVVVSILESLFDSCSNAKVGCPA